jgi:hypothetical protein
VIVIHLAARSAAQLILWRLMTGLMLALGLTGFPGATALALTLEESVDRFSQCGYQVGNAATVYSIDGTPTTLYRVWADDQYGTRELVVYVYADQDAADDVFHVLSTMDRLEGVDPAPTYDNGPLLERGAGRSIWRENVAIAQIMPLTEPTDLDTVPDSDLIRCLDGTP